MFLGEAFRMAAANLWTHKLRSTLTVLGVIIGILSVLAVVTIGTSFEHSIVSGFNTVDDRTLFVSCAYEDNPGPPGCGGLGRIFTERDRQAILALPGVAAVNREGQLPILGLVYENRSIPFQTLSTTEADATAVSSLTGGFESGRVYGSDAAEVVVSYDVATDLLGFNGTPVAPGVQVTLLFVDGTNETVTVVGVLKKETNAFIQFTAGTIYAPINRFYRLPDIESPVTREPTPVYEGFSVIAASPQDMPRIKESVAEYLESADADASHLLVQGTEFYIASGSNIVEQIGGILDNITLLISAIAVVSLVVGAIGIANIMLVSVTERTREIGVMKAIGAKDSEVLTLFLLEAVLIGVVGAVIGIALGLVAGALVVQFVFTDFTLLVPWDWVGLALAVGVLTGVLAGYMPARRATRIQPIQALAYD